MLRTIRYPYYVGTTIGLYSVPNLGTTLLASGTPVWQREGGNVLNFAIVQSLAYRPGDNVMSGVGTHGNGMYYSFLGPPNFTPNLNTGIDPVINDKNFITKVFPTISGNRVDYRIGNLFTIKKISVKVFTFTGQEIFREESDYQNGFVDFGKYARGAYILSITSDNGKYRHLQRIVKQ